ncbi:anaerobic benzoate catabolism transcriptional regulator [compost metagenome]
MAGTRQHKRNQHAINVLAKNIRKYRQQKGLTIQQLADMLDVDYSQIGRMERGTVNASVSIIFDIANLLEISAKELLNEDD